MHLYRVEARVTASYTDWESPNWATIREHTLSVRQFPITKETPKGKWVDDFGRKRWVGNDTLRRFAHPTVKEAYVAFLARKKKQKRILQAQINACIDQISLAEIAIAENNFAEPGKYYLD